MYIKIEIQRHSHEWLQARIHAFEGLRANTAIWLWWKWGLMCIYLFIPMGPFRLSLSFVCVFVCFMAVFVCLVCLGSSCVCACVCACMFPAFYCWLSVMECHRMSAMISWWRHDIEMSELNELNQPLNVTVRCQLHLTHSCQWNCNVITYSKTIFGKWITVCRQSIFNGFGSPKQINKTPNPPGSVYHTTKVCIHPSDLTTGKQYTAKPLIKAAPKPKI